VESPQISGKVFRFLSTMHPSLSKPERKKYADFDPEKWYPWTADIAGEFTDLMRRSPRDTSFARGLAYAATKGLPEDARLTPTEVVAGLATLPAAFAGPAGSGFEVQMDRPGFAEVQYRGMPGFANVCIAIAGELTQRLQAVGARGLDVKHAEGCRLQGSESCRFEIRWSADPAEMAPAGERAPERVFERPSARASSRDGETSRDARPAAPRPVSAAPAPPPPRAATPAASGDDLFEQLRMRLEEAQAQSARHAQLEAHISALDAHIAELGSALVAAQADAEGARAELDDLRRRLRELAG
jgi:uncharacterized coiled-coil protein SlyX